MNEKRVEQLLNLALVNLCEISVKGPATVPMGKAIGNCVCAAGSNPH